MGEIIVLVYEKKKIVRNKAQAELVEFRGFPKYFKANGTLKYSVYMDPH